MTGVAGWMGGTLVHRNQIGVDIRYAGAGKWKELYIDEEAGPLEVCTLEELEVDQMKLIHIKDKRIVIARSEQGFVAFDDRCTHRGRFPCRWSYDLWYGTMSMARESV
jgi:hypothetical protein